MPIWMPPTSNKQNGETALHEAMPFCGKVEVVGALLACEANRDATNNKGFERQGPV